MDKGVAKRIHDLRTEFPFMVNNPATSEQIANAETELNMKFPDDYRQMLGVTSGAMLESYPFFGTQRNELMDSAVNSVVTATSFYRRDGWPMPDGSFVISQDHAGNAICYDKDGAIRKFDHDLGATQEVADCLEAFVRLCLPD